MFAVLKKDFINFFRSISGYLYFTVFFIATAFSFFLVFDYFHIDNALDLLFIITLFFSPIVCSNLLIDEKLNNTEVLLLVSPISYSSIAIAKYFAALSLHILVSIFSMLFYSIILIFFNFNFFIYFSEAIGLFLLGASMMSIGLFVSTLSDNKNIVTFINLLISSIIFLFDGLFYLIEDTFIEKLFFIFSFKNYYNQFLYGLINLNNIMFFVIISITFLVLALYRINFKRFNDEC